MKHPYKKQQVFQEMFVGVLLYSVVLGFFNDYTDVLQTSSYSVTFLVAIVMQLLTYATFDLKKRVIKWSRAKDNTPVMVLSVWLVLFLSKFVFLAVIDWLFGGAVTISGFVGLVLIIGCLTVAQRAAFFAYKKLGED